MSVAEIKTSCPPRCYPPPETDFFIDNLLVRTHLIIVMIRWTGLASWEFEFPFPGSLTSTLLEIYAEGDLVSTEVPSTPHPKP